MSKEPKIQVPEGTNSSEYAVVVDNVTKLYQAGVAAVKNARFAVRPGEFLTIIGHSGAGKSTLIKLIIHEEEPTSGTVTVFGQSLTKMKKREIPYFRRRVGIVFQDFKLLPQKTVYENVAFALEAADFHPDDITNLVPRALQLVGLSGKDHFFPRELSGGEQQRVSIARAIVRGPRLLVADEPTGNVDPKTAWGIVNLLLKINEMGTTIILTTHNKEIVDALRRRVVVMNKGEIAADYEKGGYVLR